MSIPFSKDDGRRYDAIAVNVDTRKVRIFLENDTLPNAEAVSRMAITRRGCDEEFYAEVPTGMYKEGDTWKQKEPTDGR